MPYAVIEYKDGTKKEYCFFRGGMSAAANKAMELLVDEGESAKKIYTLDYEHDLDDVLKWCD